jgi:selenoprotein W-related protein
MKTSRVFVSLLCALVVLSAGAAVALRASDEPRPREEDVVIEIHHCTTCGFRAQAAELAAEIRKELGFKPVLIVGKIGSFDVFINGTLLFSRKEAGRFPNPGEIVQMIEDFLDNPEEDRQ